jgi:hypothetical protein
VQGIACATAAVPDLDGAEELQRKVHRSRRPADDATFMRSSAPARQHHAHAWPDPVGALAIFDQVIAIAERIGDQFVEMIEYTNAGWARLAMASPGPSSSPATSS